MFVCERERACVCLRVCVGGKERIFVCLRVTEGVGEVCVCVGVNIECACVRMHAWVGG